MADGGTNSCEGGFVKGCSHSCIVCGCCRWRSSWRWQRGRLTLVKADLWRDVATLVLSVAVVGGDQAEEGRGSTVDKAGRRRTEVWSQAACHRCCCWLVWVSCSTVIDLIFYFFLTLWTICFAGSGNTTILTCALFSLSLTGEKKSQKLANATLVKRRNTISWLLF